jgi:hypothetical protein
MLLMHRGIILGISYFIFSAALLLLSCAPPPPRAPVQEADHVEFDWAEKWAEAVGQSLHYARMTGKRPGIVLILREESESQNGH